MKLLILFFLLTRIGFAKTDVFFSSIEANKICQKAISINSNFSRTNLKFIKGDEKEVFFVFKRNNVSEIIIYDLKKNVQKRIFLEEEIVDLYLREQDLILLSPKKVLFMDRQDLFYILQSRTLPDDLTYRKNAYAVELAVNQDFLFISHGLHGVIQFDLVNFGVVKVINPIVPQPNESHRSALTGVEIKNKVLYMAFDDVTLDKHSKAFEGLVVYDIENDQVIRTIPVNQKKEAYYKPHLEIIDNELQITNLNLVYRHRLEKLVKDKWMNPFFRLWKFPHGELIGRGYSYENHYNGCFVDFQKNIITSDAYKL